MVSKQQVSKPEQRVRVYISNNKQDEENKNVKCKSLFENSKTMASGIFPPPSLTKTPPTRYLTIRDISFKPLLTNRKTAENP